MVRDLSRARVAAWSVLFALLVACGGGGGGTSGGTSGDTSGGSGTGDSSGGGSSDTGGGTADGGSGTTQTPDQGAAAVLPTATVSESAGAVVGQVSYTDRVASSRAVEVPRAAAWVQVGSGSDVKRYFTTSDDSGRFALGNLAPGDWEVRSSYPGYLQGSATVRVNVNQSTDAGRFELAPDPDPSTGGIRGRVLDGNGGPIGGAIVGLRSDTLTGAETYLTDDDGTYTLLNVLPGEWTVAAQRFGVGAAEQRVSVQAGQLAIADFVLTGSTGQATLAEQPPSVTARSSHRTAVAGVTVELDANVTLPAGVDAQVTRYEWDFEGDGTYDYQHETTPKVQHAYTATGAYTPRLRVTDSRNKTAVAKVLVNIANPAPPQVRATVDPAAGTVHDTYHFAPQVTLAQGIYVARYAWDFGDGSAQYVSATLGSPTHAYAAAGNYTATVTISDSLGQSASAQVTVRVTVEGSVTVGISPASVKVSVKDAVTFTAAVTGTTDQRVTWRVKETGGGSVTAAGVYTAPATPGTYHVEVTSRASTSATDTATITVVSGGAIGTVQ